MAFIPLQVENGISLPLMSFADSSKKDFGASFIFQEPDLKKTLPIYSKNLYLPEELSRPSEKINKKTTALLSLCVQLHNAIKQCLIYTPTLYKIVKLGMQFLERNQYHTDDPYVKEIINQEIRKEMVVNFNSADADAAGRQKKGKSAHEQNLFNLKNNDGKFKYLWAEGEGIEDIDYQDQQNKRKREKDMELVEPPRYKIIGYTTDRGCKLKKRPILRMSDLYLTSNPKIRRLVNRVFDRHIYGRSDSRKGEGDVIISRTASNAHQLQEILKNHQGHEEDYNFENQQMQMNQKQLEEYIIDRGQSKQNYFLFYKHEEPKRVTYQVKNNPMNSQHFLRQLHAEVRQIERKYDRPEEIEEAQEEEKQLRKEEQKKVKEYFGQFKTGGREKVTQKFTIQDTFECKIKASEAKANSIIDYFSYIDNEIVQQKYLQGLPDNDKLELNLANPYFFQPKLHTILHREKEFFQENEYRAKLAQANKGNKLDMSLLSGYSGGRGGKSKMVSGLGSEPHQLNGEQEEEHLSLQRVIETQIKNVYREPLKHSQVATKYDFVKFTFEEECFNHLHRFNFAFHDHLGSGRVRVEVGAHKNRKARPNGLVINSEMKESNDKFSRKEDLSLVRGQFILIEYIQENPLLMSDVGMCERMMIQVNYLEILEKVKAEALLNKSFEEMEEERDVRKTAQAMSFQKHCDLWRKCIKDTFGENGKQFFWEPKNNGKLIGIPDGPGVTLMESNLCNVPIVRKKPNRREFLLVREGKRWVIRRIESLYVSGQIQPHKKVFCPGSRTHTEFKSAYEKAYIVKQIKQYGSVNFDQLKLAFKGETENSLRRALKNANTISKDSKLYRQASEEVRMNENQLTPEQIVLYQRMQRSLCELREAGITEIKTNEKMKNVLKEFNRKHFTNQEKITIARMIREQLQLTSWYLTQSFLKYKAKTSKIEINGFADPTNGRGGYSYINKPQKERTSKEDMEDRAEKQRTSTLQDLRKLKVDDSKQRLRAMGHNEDEIDFKGRWQLINLLKNKEGTEFSRRQRQTKNKKIENQKKEINRNFNRLLAYLNDQTQEPAFDYARQKRNKLEDYMLREREYFNKINRKYGKPQQTNEAKEDNRSDDSDQDD